MEAQCTANCFLFLSTRKVPSVNVSLSFSNEAQELFRAGPRPIARQSVRDRTRPVVARRPRGVAVLPPPQRARPRRAIANSTPRAQTTWRWRIAGQRSP